MEIIDPESSVSKIVELVKKSLPDPLDENIAEVKRSQVFSCLENNPIIKNSPSIIMVLNHQTTLYDYFSSNVKDILGYDPEKYMKEGISFAMKTVHADHQPILNLIYSGIINQIQQADAFEAKNLRFTVTFKVNKADGKSIWVMEQFMVIEMDELGKAPFLTLSFMNDLTGIKKDELADLVVAQNKKGGYMPIYASSFHSIMDQMVFSKRELEILQYLSKGNSSKEIADQLHLSEHTVKTHRKNMFKKTDTKNITELIRFAASKGLISLT